MDTDREKEVRIEKQKQDGSTNAVGPARARAWIELPGANRSDNSSPPLHT